MLEETWRKKKCQHADYTGKRNSARRIIPTPPPGFRFMAFNGDKALSSSLCEPLADDIAAAISEDEVEGVIKAGLETENMSTV